MLDCENAAVVDAAVETATAPPVELDEPALVARRLMASLEASVATHAAGRPLPGGSEWAEMDSARCLADWDEVGSL